MGYIRRSKKAEENTVSLDAQLSAIRRYCDNHGLTLVETITHNGISGTKRARFAEIERLVKVNEAKAIVVYNLDRLGRDTIGILNHFQFAQAAGVTIHETTTRPIDISTPVGELQTSIRAALDGFYVKVIKVKTRDALAELKKQGRRYTRCAPFGYEWSGAGMVENEEEQKALKVIEQCRGAGYGRVRTLRALQAAGYRGRGSGSTIQKLLEDP